MAIIKNLYQNAFPSAIRCQKLTPYTLQQKMIFPMSGHGHRSSISQHSHSASQFFNNSDELTDAELIKQVNDLKRLIKILTLENEILQNTIMRLEPSLMHGIQSALEYANKLHSNTSLNIGSYVKSRTSAFGMLESMISPSRMLTSPSRISTSRRLDSSGKIGGRSSTVIFGMGPRINVLERSELVSIEMETIIATLEKIKKKTAKEHAMLRAQIEEIGVRVAEVDKAVAMFNQSVIIEGWDKIAQRIPAEIWLRFMTEWLKLADKKIGKMRLRTSTLNTQFSKLTGQIKVKGELSESLRPVDFEKLKIENDECQLAIEHKLVQLEELKKMTGDANLNLTIHKKLMMEQNNYLTNMIETRKNKEQQQVQLGKERDAIEAQADALEERLEEVKKVRIAYEVPNIMDYVTVKSEVTELNHSIKILQNRQHIHEIALTSLRQKLYSMSRMNQ